MGLTRDVVQRRIDSLTMMLVALDRFEDLRELPVESTLLWYRTFERGSTARRYLYVAVKYSSDRWAVTGRDGDVALRFEDLVRVHLSSADEVWLAAEWEQVS